MDARHDFKGVAADLEAYWPKLKTGGIFAGHDYIRNILPFSCCISVLSTLIDIKHQAKSKKGF